MHRVRDDATLAGQRWSSATKSLSRGVRRLDSGRMGGVTDELRPDAPTPDDDVANDIGNTPVETGVMDEVEAGKDATASTSASDDIVSDEPVSDEPVADESLVDEAI